MHPEWVHHDTGAAVFLDAMAWWDADEGLVFGDPVNDCLTLLVTRDGGQTWTQTPCNDTLQPLEGEAGFAASKRLFAFKGTPHGCSPEDAHPVLSEHRSRSSWTVTSSHKQGGTMTGCSVPRLPTRNMVWPWVEIGP